MESPDGTARASLWRAGAPAPMPAQSTIDGDHDVIVVGAGLTGLATGLLLARAGRSVAVVEARAVGAGTTGGSTAKVSVLQGRIHSRIAGRHGQAVLASYVAANTEALEWVRRYADDHGVAAQERAAITYATTGEGERTLREESAAARSVGLPVEWLDELALPFRVRGGIRLADQLQVDPMQLLAALAQDLVAHGGVLVEGARVQRVTGRDPVVVSTTAGEARAATVVVATNMPVLDRGGFFARASPERSYALAFRTPARAVDAMYLSVDDPARSLRDAPAGAGDSGSLLLVGGNGHPTGRARSPRDRVEGLRSWTHDHFPDAEESHAWAAQDFVTASGLPYVGPLLPGREEILVAGGYAKWGMTNAVGAALALSARILGGRTDWASAFEPWRHVRARGVPDVARINAAVGLEMTRGWLRPVAGIRPGHASSEPAEGEGTVQFDRAGPPTAVSRVDGEVRRVSAVCPHLGGILRWNDAELSWDCPLHGSRFAADGEVLEGPATCGLAAR